jgi:hypothetical protein
MTAAQARRAVRTGDEGRRKAARQARARHATGRGRKRIQNLFG